MELKLKEAML